MRQGKGSWWAAVLARLCVRKGTHTGGGVLGVGVGEAWLLALPLVNDGGRGAASTPLQASSCQGDSRTSQVTELKQGRISLEEEREPW